MSPSQTQQGQPHYEPLPPSPVQTWPGAAGAGGQEAESQANHKAQGLSHRHGIIRSRETLAIGDILIIRAVSTVRNSLPNHEKLRELAETGALSQKTKILLKVTDI